MHGHFVDRFTIDSWKEELFRQDRELPGTIPPSTSPQAGDKEVPPPPLADGKLFAHKIQFSGIHLRGRKSFQFCKKIQKRFLCGIFDKYLRAPELDQSVSLKKLN